MKQSLYTLLVHNCINCTYIYFFVLFFSVLLVEQNFGLYIVSCFLNVNLLSLD